MSRQVATIVGWALIAVVAAICFLLDHLRAQYLYFNWFVIFTLVASAVLVATLWFLEHRIRSGEPLDDQSDNRNGRGGASMKS